MAKKTVLIVDDEAGIRESLTGIFEDEGYETLTAPTAEDALSLLKEKSPDIVFLDVWLPEMDGIEALTKICEIDNNLPVVIISGHGNIELAIKATRLGAYDFLEKPLSLEKVLLVAQRALERRKLEVENRTLRADLGKRWKLIGESGKMRALRKQIEMAAQSSSRVLILGESGTGKELVARQLHENGPRSNSPFVEVNCAAIPQELIESELFGHEKGSFTGASERKIGKFELANEGSLFLDEIGDMALQTQAKVLRVIETQVFQRVGGAKNIKVDVRIIAATNKDLAEEVKKGNFREDLFFRLNVIPLSVPPLRERKEDIQQLAEHFIDIFSTENGTKPKELGPDAIRLFHSYNWPGNIRELRNAIERLLIMAPSSNISASDISALGMLGSTQSIRNDFTSFTTLKEARDAFEKEFILRKLQDNDWNVSKTADSIAVERSNLHKKIKTYGISENRIKQ
ncbi:MAG TPA: sigma-54 dependent transcriptional regulator [Dissulfurispiraceae bacterium]|nr:sigma-54 dependent transcriptional regulator [Dissulfurispiraceae bacterium]